MPYLAGFQSEKCYAIAGQLKYSGKGNHLWSKKKYFTRVGIPKVGKNMAMRLNPKQKVSQGALIINQHDSIIGRNNIQNLTFWNIILGILVIQSRSTFSQIHTRLSLSPSEAHG